MKTSKLKIITIFALFLLLLLSIVVNAATEKDLVLSKLNEFYETAKLENVDKYVLTQDEEYLKIITQNGNYKAYFSAVFNLTDILSYEIVDPKVTLIDKERAVVFYELKSEVKIIETGELKKIDNEMVAFLFKYPNGWVVRYTVLQELFEDKMATEVIGEGLITANLINDQNSSTLKQEFVKKNLINPKDLSLYKTPSSSINKSLILIIASVIILIAIIIGFIMMKKKKHHANKESKHHIHNDESQK